MSTLDRADLHRALIETLPDAVIFTDREGVIRAWNGGAEAVFGHRAAEVIGKSLDIIIPERLRRAHWAGFDAAVETGRMKHGRESMTTRSTHKDGRDLYVDMSFALVRGTDGAVLGAVAVGRDITGRFVADRETRKRLAELEARVKALVG
jgi:PAS domain S-box-containing protein